MKLAGVSRENGGQNRVNRKKKQKLEEELNRPTSEILKSDVEKNILSGSLVSKNLRKSNDIDLLVIKKTEKRFLDGLDEFYQHLKPRVGV